MSIATSNFSISSELFKLDDKNIHVTICNKNISYKKWFKRIQKTVGDELFYKPPYPFSAKVYFCEKLFHYTSSLSSVKQIIKAFSPSTPCNIRLELFLASGIETYIFLLDNEGLSKPKDINTKISFFTHHTQNNTCIESVSWINFIAEVLGTESHNNIITDFRVESIDFFDAWMFAEPKEIFELLRIKYALKDVRISINNQTWIIYTLTD